MCMVLETFVLYQVIKYANTRGMCQLWYYTLTEINQEGGRIFR